MTRITAAKANGIVLEIMNATLNVIKVADV
jgi:hypothetical protein